MKDVVVIIPAYNEENGVGKVIDDIPNGLVDEIVVVNNNSTDETSKVAEQKGATVIEQPIRGYGNACLKGIEYLNHRKSLTSIVVFLDADYSDHPEQMPLLLDPIIKGQADMVIGSRSLGNREKGSMTFPQIFGNWLATWLIHVFFGHRYTDLGPFRTIKYDKLMELDMKDRTFGWTVEMQIKAIKRKLKIMEVPVDYKNRIGFSKISGTVSGTISAGYKIITTIFKYR